MTQSRKKLAIIGTAGRKEDGERLSGLIYESMLTAARTVIKLEKITHLVSGGAAWADHVAVTIFIRDRKRPEKLTLHLPAIYDSLKGQYFDSGERDFISNPGGTANYYHKKFSQALQINSLWELGEAWAACADFVVTPGFKERNTKVANEADVLLAMTFGEGARVKDGGTADTVSKFLSLGKGSVYHYNLNDLSLYGNGNVNERTS
jgi:hypothetical protein